MSEPNEASRVELERLGWKVSLTNNLGLWNLKAIRGPETWIYFAPEAQEAWIAAVHMARRHSSNASDKGGLPHY